MKPWSASNLEDRGELNVENGANLQDLKVWDEIGRWVDVAKVLGGF